MTAWPMFIDVALPGMSGHDTARRLRSTPGLEGAVLVAVTGYGQEEDRRVSLQAGFDHHWVKPLSFDALTDLLASYELVPGTVFHAGYGSMLERGPAGTLPNDTNSPVRLEEKYRAINRGLFFKASYLKRF